MAITKAAEARRRNYHYMADAMRKLEWDLHQEVFRELRIPAGWHEIAREKGAETKARVTIRLDDDVVKFFRSMGTDWQPRMNRVLSVWMHARLAGLIDGAETMDYLRRTSDDAIDDDGPRPDWADQSRRLEAIDEDLAWGDFGRDNPGVPMEAPGVKKAEETFAQRVARMKAEYGVK